MKRKIFTLSGAPTSGKTTLGGYISRNLNIPRIITTTTRAPREGEIDGVDYYFTTRKVFPLIPHIAVTQYRGESYGIPTTALEHLNDCFVILDRVGVRALMQVQPPDTEVIPIHIHANSHTVITRLRNRGHSYEEIIRIISKSDIFEIPPEAKYVIVNDDGMLERAHELLDHIICVLELER